MQEWPKDVIHRLVNCQNVAFQTPQRRTRIVNMYGETFPKLAFGFVGSAQNQPAINVDRFGPETNRNVHLRARILADNDCFAVRKATFKPARLVVQIGGPIHLLDDTHG